MRRLVLSGFLCLAACGGAISSPSTDASDPSSGARAAQAVLLSAEGQATLAAFAKGFSQDAIDSCVAAWEEDFGGPSGLGEPIAKPDVKGLRSFLAQCLGSVPEDVRAAGTGNL
jgi:hypothetical protein